MKVRVLGSGMAGYGATYRLRAEGVTPDVYDKNAYPFGHTVSYEHKASGFVFDDGPHVSFTKDKRIQDLVERIDSILVSVPALDCQSQAKQVAWNPEISSIQKPAADQAAHTTAPCTASIFYSTAAPIHSHHSAGMSSSGSPLLFER